MSSVIAFGVSLSTDERIDNAISPLNGRSPVAISYNVTAADQRSAAAGRKA